MLKVDLAEATVDAHVVPDDVQEVPIIIGQPFTDKPGVVVVQREGMLRLFDEAAAQLPELEKLPPRKVTLWALDATVIPPGEAADIKVIIKDNIYKGDVYVELSVRGKEGQEHCIPRCVMNTSVGLLPVVNLADHPLEIKKMRVVARGNAAEEHKLKEQHILRLVRDKCRDNSRNKLPVEDVTCGDDVPVAQRNELIEMLNEFRDCFALNTSELGKTNLAELDVELTSDKPIYYRPYRLSYSERDKVRGIINELKENGVIRESNLPFASPILLVRKKSGDIRMCVDYRALNAITKKIGYPLPIIEDQINSLVGATRFTSLDLFSGYHQVPLAEKAVEKSSFITPDGQYEWLRMPFGMVNAPSVLARLVAKVIAPLIGKADDSVIQAYIDDIVIASKSNETALQALRLTLQRLRETGLTLKLSKCRFLMPETDFLGYEISSEGIRPGRYKTDAVEKFKTPTNVHEVRQFVGLASFFRKFIREFGTIARPLTMLTK